MSNKELNEKYKLSDGVFYHNHELDTPVIDPKILSALDKFDASTAITVKISRQIQTQFNK